MHCMTENKLNLKFNSNIYYLGTIYLAILPPPKLYNSLNIDKEMIIKKFP